MVGYSTDEITPLMEEEGGGGKNQHHHGNNWNRFFVIGFLSLLVLFDFVYNEYKIEGLNEDLQTEKARVVGMEETVRAQGEMIDRFNQSITNDDILKQIAQLQRELNQTREDVSTQLEEAQVDIGVKLDQTMITLNQVVATAEAEIETKVDSVKEDVASYVISTEAQFSTQNSFMIYQLAGTFVVLACLISMWHMTAHLRKMKQPIVQRKILAILWMVPVYSLTSWVSLIAPQIEGYLAIIKDGYEAYVIYMFLSFCISVLGKGNRDNVVLLLEKHADHLTPPFRFDGFWNPNPYDTDRKLASAVLLQCQIFTMQFVFLRPLITLITFVLAETKCYGYSTNGPNDYRAPQPYLSVIQNISVFVAFTGLLKFYHAVDAELQWCRPFAKFLCIKGVVFMTFWQGLALTILASATNVSANQDATQWANSAQDFLICLEMLFASIAHFYCFPTDEWSEGYKDRMLIAAKTKTNIGDTIAIGDFVQDLKLIMRKGEKKMKKMKKKKELTDEGKPDDITDEHNKGNNDDDSTIKHDDDDNGDADIDVEALVTTLEQSIRKIEGNNDGDSDENIKDSKEAE